MHPMVMFGVGSLVVVVMIVAVFFATKPSAPTADDTATAAPTAPDSGDGTGPAGGKILSYSLTSGSMGLCQTDAQCNTGSTCEDGSCTVYSCARCVPESTVELGNPECLDYWDAPSNEERMLSRTGTHFAAPIDSHSCENFHPHFELETPAGACSVSFSNRCEKID